MLALTVSPLKTWEDFIPYGKRKFLRAKTIIFRQGEIEPGFYYVKKGIVKIFTMKPDINKRILDVAGPGMLIGEHTMDQLPCFSTAISHEDSILYHFTKMDYEELSRKHPEITLLFAQSLIHKKKLLLNNSTFAE
ncbi:Crp/Fnr family transcriptional regulator [Siminovitchia sp. 179-K 8D1 HS]|uniref:Crp/Fnr family transcriptional regulator n=1 Tax=Siminovitchia sp. 179-K 8D1 HS TaxID=3142385 RepID=UPI0039A07C41